MKTYNGMYLGIVVQNNDPDYRGRVKVYVPHIQANVYQNWYSEITDKTFSFPGKNLKSDLNKILPELKNILPWAENAMANAGAIGSGRYNAYDEIGTVSDSNRNETIKPDTHQVDVEKKYKLNDEHLGEKPGKVYEPHELWVSDAFTNTQDPDSMSQDNAGDGEGSWPFEDLSVGDRLNGVNRPNKFAWNYRPNTYSNCAKGSFSIPNVGAHVWVFFQDGDPLHPVVFAAMHGREDWRGIYDSQSEHGIDYPGTYENKSKDEERVFDTNTETYRNKYVINQKGGTLEFVNTDNREILKMTHYSGSFLEFNNHTNIQFAAINNQRLVQEDDYDTVKGFRNVYTERDLDHIIRGDYYHKVGYQNFNHHLNWRETMHELAQVKGLFDIKRVDGSPGQNGKISQSRAGMPAPCPVCMDVDITTGVERVKYARLYNQFMLPIVQLKTDTSKAGGNGANKATMLNMAPGYFDPRGRFPSAPAPPNPVQYVMTDPTNALPQQYMSASLYEQVAIDPLWVLKGPGFVFGEKCPCCGGKGLSPSSMEGKWIEEEQKSDAKFKQLVEQVTEKLAPIESEMGLGGTDITTIAKHKVENIGMVMNDFPSIRTDPVGKMYRSDIQIHKHGVFINQKPTPMIEPVHVDDLPGGSYSLNVANRWNVHVGAGGVSIKSYGRVEIGGSQVTVGGDQVNIGSKNEVNIDGGSRLNIVSDIISIRQRNRGQVLVDSNLGVSQNVVVGGGLHVEGELSCQHITAPVEIHETEVARIFSKLLKGLTFTCDINGGTHVVSPHGTAHPNWSSATVTLISDSNDDHVVDYGHSHLFKNAAMHLVASNDLVRDRGKDCTESGVRVSAQDVEVKTSGSKVKVVIPPRVEPE